MNYISYDEFKKSSLYSDFISLNPSVGYLKIKIDSALESYPVEGVEVLIYKDIGEDLVVFYYGKTDSNGIIDNIVLPSPKAMNINSLEVPDYEVYSLKINKKGYKEINYLDVVVYSDIKVIQNISLEPLIKID